MRWKDLRRSSNVRDVRGAGGGRLPMRARRGGVGGGVGALVILVLVFIFGGPEAVMQLLGGGGGVAPSGEQGRAADGQRRDERLRRARARQHRGRLGRAVRAAGAALPSRPSSRCSAAPCNPPAATRARRPVRSIAPATGASISTRRSSTSSRAWAAPAISPRRTSSATRSGITCRLARHVRSGARRAAARRARPTRIACKSRWSCKPIASPASGRITRTEATRVLEPGDVEEGLGAAAAIGDDGCSATPGRSVTPDSFTHGSSADRQRWLSTGLRTGDPSACNTFN